MIFSIFASWERFLEDCGLVVWKDVNTRCECTDRGHQDQRVTESLHHKTSKKE